MSDNPNGGRDVDESGSLVSEPSRRQLSSLQKLGIAGLILVVFLSYIWATQLMHNKAATKPPEPTPPPSSTAFRAAPIVMPPLPEPLPLPPPRVVARSQGQREMTPAESPILAFGVGSASAEGQPLAVSSPVPSERPSLPVAPTGPIGERLKPTMLQTTKAVLLPHPDMLVTQGTIIPCTLQTAIDTQLAGFVKCVLSEDVRGTTGNVVLLDRGTTVVGEIQTGLLQGQERVFVLWDRAETPQHAVITLSSPGSDELGRAGLPGTVNNHWWKRFGSAILLSVIQGGLQAGTALAGNSGNSGTGTSFNSFQSSGTDVSNTALQASINIPPTLTKNQGDTVTIFVAKDLDFSDIYSLRIARSEALP